MFKRFTIIVTIFILLILVLLPNTISYEKTNSSNGSGIKSIFAAYPLIDLEYEEIEELVIPNDGKIEIPFNITFELTGRYADFQSKRLKNDVINIELSIEEKPSFCKASIEDTHVKIPVDSTQPYRSTLKVELIENAEAFKQNYVKVKAISPEISGLFFTQLKAGENSFEIPFVVGYKCVVSYEMPKGTITEVGPLETADFQIDIENLGNGPTRVEIDLIDEPKKGWSVSIASSVQLGSGIHKSEAKKKTVHLKIKPPYEFGLHNEREAFGIKLTPSYLGNPQLRGHEEIIYFNVQNVGMSPGAGYEIPLIIIVVVLFIITCISIFLKRRKRHLTK
jgi:hypothetical protein